MMIEEDQGSSTATREKFNLLAGTSDSDDGDVNHPILMIGGNVEVDDYDLDMDYSVDDNLACAMAMSVDPFYSDKGAYVKRLKGGCPDSSHDDDETASASGDYDYPTESTPDVFGETAYVSMSESDNESTVPTYEGNDQQPINNGAGWPRPGYRIVTCDPTQDYRSHLQTNAEGEVIRVGNNGLILPKNRAGPHIFRQVLNFNALQALPESNTVMMLQSNSSDSLDQDPEVVPDHSSQQLHASAQTQRARKESQKTSGKGFCPSPPSARSNDSTSEVTSAGTAQSAQSNELSKPEPKKKRNSGRERGTCRTKNISKPKQTVRKFLCVSKEQESQIEIEAADEAVDGIGGNQDSKQSSSVEVMEGLEGVVPERSRTPMTLDWLKGTQELLNPRRTRFIQDPKVIEENKIDRGYNEALLVVRAQNELSHHSKESLQLEDQYCGIWIVNTTTTFYMELIRSLTYERRFFAVVKDLREAQDFYHTRDNTYLTPRNENHPFTRKEDCEQPRRLNRAMTDRMHASHRPQHTMVHRNEFEEFSLEHIDTRVHFVFYQDDRIGTEDLLFFGKHQNFRSAWSHAVNQLRYYFSKGNMLTPDRKRMWYDWFGAYKLTWMDVKCEYQGVKSNVTVKKAPPKHGNDMFELEDSSRNGSLEIKVSFEESAYQNMLPGRDLLPTVAITKAMKGKAKKAKRDLSQMEIKSKPAEFGAKRQRSDLLEQDAEQRTLQASFDENNLVGTEDSHAQPNDAADSTAKLEDNWSQKQEWDDDESNGKSKSSE